MGGRRGKSGTAGARSATVRGESGESSPAWPERRSVNALWDPDLTPRKQKREAAFQERVEKTETCWLWTGNLFTGSGYGQFYLNGRRCAAHAVSYAWYVGDLPPGMEIDHTCRVKRCVRPDHLQALTHRQNILRTFNPWSINAQKLRCCQGHLFSEDSYVDVHGFRVCRVCKRAKERRKYHQRKAKRQASA